GMLASFVASGIPSAYYPHLPPEFTRPLPQLFALLIAHGYAPHNAGAWVGLYGSGSMLPLAACALPPLALCLNRVEGARTRALLAATSAILGAVLLIPLWYRPIDDPAVARAVAFVTRHFSPEGHDDAARLRAKLLASKPMREAELQELAELYEAEG